MSNTRLTKKVFNYEKRLNGVWYQNLYLICESVDMLDKLENHVPVEIGELSKKLMEAYERAWEQEICKMSKLRYYC